MNYKVLLCLSATLTAGCSALNFRKQAVGRLVETSPAAGQAMPPRLYVTELEVFDNPEWWSEAKGRVVDDNEWDSGVDAWRERYAKMLITVVGPRVPNVELVFVPAADLPSTGLLLRARMQSAAPAPDPVWGYFTVELVDLASSEERYFARLEVPATVVAANGWNVDLGWTVMSFAWLLEPLLKTGAVAPRAPKIRPWTIGLYDLSRREPRYWRARARAAAKAGHPAQAKRYRVRAEALAELKTTTTEKLTKTPACASHFALGQNYNACIKEERGKYP